MENQPTTNDAPTLPKAPEYELPYDRDSVAVESAKRSGYYGIMYAGNYEWDNQTCTAEAYGEYDADARPGERHRMINGQPRRSLKFHTTWMDADKAEPCLREIGSYNRFDGDVTADALDDLPDAAKVVVGRESSPVMYVWTVDAPAVYDVFDNLIVDDTVDDPDAIVPATDHRPNELGGVPNADTFPVATVGKSRGDLDTGVPTLLRAWWD
ncbi:hypothetical protein C471_08595 [Halorubrum saccharovorum DSM 1137]|uniref:Uncharacterized protein n=2 Tax=Halorubrum saccharovorum TaxID=2248 RepID=M0DYZ3_9EURY|nr:hypothetical protein C471_08595 [Halorubrum saccharovorum DSM 1137]